MDGPFLAYEAWDKFVLRLLAGGGFCAKNHTKASASEAFEGDLYEKSYKSERLASPHQHFERKIVQKLGREKLATGICTKSRAKANAL
ncbi:hypothetical protein D3P08_12250 [Paenibacillus nanensis]|uniref:Uncharacterized protein n=1 Tax=Paenibacillus nanensis TaxID=393251 RepID=A0A3A1V5E6_9BACL|nr:hypothetical protein [Paenibacillus nanensis]RIX52770.1 hypothetical protein D3P08_12250 [Paenibacillus nanensis]